jgi:thiamine kinase-like enzyme
VIILAEKTEKPKVDVKEEPKEEPTVEETGEEEISEEEESKLPFPLAPVVRIMKANMDDEKMIKKDVKIAMNRWLGNLCARVSREMNKFPYVMMHLHEFEHATEMYRKLEEYEKEKERILAHFDAIKKDIEKLERDLGKVEDDVMEMG